MPTRLLRGASIALVLGLFVAPRSALAGMFNRPPAVSSVSIPPPVQANGTATIACGATDDSSVLGMKATVSGGALPDGDQFVITPGAAVSGTLRWSTPAPGSYTVTCIAQDGSYSGSKAVPVEVAEPASPPPAVSEVSGPAVVLAGKAAAFEVTAVDPGGAALAYAWSADGGTIAEDGAQASWTAPEAGGLYLVSVRVSNAGGGFATAQAAVRVIVAGYDGEMTSEIRVPRRMAAGASGELFVVDGRGNLWFVTARGGLKGRALLPAAALAVAVTPAGLAVSTASGPVLLVDPANARVVRTLAAGPAPGATGLAWEARRGLLWLAERERGQLRAVTLDGATSLVVRSAGATPLEAPVDVGVDASSGTVWAVLETSESGKLAHAFDVNGNYLRSAVSSDEVSRAGGLAVGANGRLLVSDIFLGQVRVFTAAGQAAGVIGTYGTKPGELRQPAGVAFVGDDTAVVASMETGRLERFGAGAPLPTCAGDADCDGLPDAWELAHGLDPTFAGDAWADLDGDGLTSAQEYALGTHPRRADTDGDGVADGEELLAGDDPRDPGDHAPVLAASDPAPSGPGLIRISSSAASRGPGCAVAWQQLAGPKVALRDATTFSPSFVARGAGRYQFEGAIRCGDAAGSPVTVTATVENVPPRADGGRIAVVRPGAQVAIDGAFTADANGDLFSLEWDQVFGPALASPVAATVLTAYAATPGYRVFELTAKDAAGSRASANAEVYVVPPGIAPTAMASSPLLAEVGSAVTLDASASVGQGASAFEWRQVSGDTVALDGADAAVAGFVAPRAGHYGFEVSVVVDGVRSPPAKVDVYVAEQGAALPVAQVATVGSAIPNEPLSLDGAGSRAGANGELTYRWRQVAGPAAGLTDADRAVATVVPFASGSYVFELVVGEGAAASVPARVQFSASRAGEERPVAIASARGMGLTKSLLLLDGRRSRGRPTGYRWTQVSGPWVEISEADQALAGFRPLVPGVYSFELEVDDGTARSAPAQVSVLVFDGGLR